MPGLNVPPLSPTATGTHPAHNGHSHVHDAMTIADIKERAKESVQKEARGFSALSLLGTARSQCAKARSLEDMGDLKGGLDALTKSASLTRMFMDSNEFKAENNLGKHGVLFKELSDFMVTDGADLTERSNALEKKILEIEKTSPPAEHPRQDVHPVKLGSSIADRLRSLQDAGLRDAAAKRFSTPNMATPPLSPGASRPDRHSLPGPPAPPTTNPPNMALGMPISSAPSPHALVSPSTLGPPSPTSSPSSSPRLTHLNISEFSQAFPPIDELEGLDGLISPSNNPPPPGLPTSVRPFPVLPVDPGPRPSSTPVRPTINGFVSRPGSPIIPKPSNLGPNNFPATPPTLVADRLEFPVTNMIQPKVLHEFSSKGFKVLMLDVRHRAEFEKEHITAEAVVCLEPSVLLRENVNGEMLEDSLTVAPRHEWTLFCNRDKFDLVAIYDQSSEKFGSPRSPLSVLFRAIYETAFQKILKKMPVLIVGGLDAWRTEFGDDEIFHGSPSPSSPDPPRPTAVPGSRTGSNNPFLVSSDPHKIWTPQTKGEASDLFSDPNHSPRPEEEQSGQSIDKSSEPSQTSADKPYTNEFDLVKPFPRKQPASRPSPIPMSPSNSRNFSDNVPSTSPMINNSSPILYPQFSRSIQSVSASTSSFTSLPMVSPPPQASINPSLSRRRSDYIDQSQEALSGLHSARPSIDYPDLVTQPVLRRPPVAASSALERQDNRPRIAQHGHSFTSASSTSEPLPPRIASDYPVTYWSDIQIATSGLKNMGNTCYMNAPIQCLSATVPFSRFFTDGRWKNAVNFMNPLGTKGHIARSFAHLLHDMWHGELPHITPMEFRNTICRYEERFRGSDQHDSQEFLSFLLDGIHEDLNRILNKPPWVSTPEHEAELERLPQQIASEQEWRIWRMRNDSLVVDFFQGQFKNRLECMTCHKTSTTYDPFTSLPLPVPSGRISKVSLRQCLDAFVKTEVMEKNDAWRCPNCKELRKTTKTLSLSRLPPILIVHLKRFSFEGRWTDKIDTFVDFPMKGLDLSNYIPPPLPPGVDKGILNGPRSISPDDPRSQLPPYRYDLYAVTNHFGSLSSGHYTAFVSSRGGWLYCDDSSVKPADGREVVNKQAYILFYKRTRV